MFIDTIPNRKSPPAVLLRESYREGGRVKKRTLAKRIGVAHGHDATEVHFPEGDHVETISVLARTYPRISF